MTGKLYGLGVGPGDPELISLKAWRILRAVPVVAYPAPDDGASFARAIVARWLSPAQTEIAIRVPMEAARHPAQAVYDQAAELIGTHLDAARDVAVLCQGDPFFYGSFMYLFGRLSERFACEVVPGVSSLGACAAAAGFPLAARNDVLSIVPATLDDSALIDRLRHCDAAAIIKLGRNFARLRALLEQLGLAASACYVERATLGNARLARLDEIDPATVPYFSMVLVHRRGEAWR